jgi:hypothetical protein
MTLQIEDLDNAKEDVDHIADIANSQQPTATDRMGHTKLTIKGVLDYLLEQGTAAIAVAVQAVNNAIGPAVAVVVAAGNQAIAAMQALVAAMGYQVPVTYAAGINLTQPNQTVTYGGQTYAPISTELPFTTSGTFETAKFRLIQGVSGADLAASSGANMVGLLLGGKVQDAIKYVAPEMFGTPGVGANDNALFTAAFATGYPVRAMGPLYRLNALVVTVPADITFGAWTFVRNMQTSGTKVKAIQFNGGGLTGTAVTVTGVGGSGLPSSFHTDNIEVSDASGFAVGDTVRLFEDMPLQLCTRSANPGEYQDFNYREFTTIQSIVGSIITFNEFLRWPYSTTRALKLQKVVFLENPVVRGGKFIGGIAGGGGLGFSFCRYAHAERIRGLGNSEADRNGGPPWTFSDCWESTSDDTVSKWTLFTHQSSRNQSCNFTNISGKRTTNGGVISSGDIFCSIGPIVEDSPGDNNGDGLGLHNGSRFNTYGPFVISGARCYSMWLHQSCDDNTFLTFNSTHGITGGVYCFGDRNHFPSAKITGHPSFGIALNGDNNAAHVDIEVSGTGVRIGPGTTGNRVTGRSVSTGSDTFARDLIMNDSTYTVIDLVGGSRGMVYANGVVENHTNDIILRGPLPYTLRRAMRSSGAYSWNYRFTGVSVSASKDIVVPGLATDTNGLKTLVASAADDGEIYVIRLQPMSTVANTYSEYRAVTRQNSWALVAVVEGSSSFAPRLAVSTNKLVLTLNSSSTALQVNMKIDRY